MPNPIVSISMPFMNAEPYFELCLKSIFNQSFKDWELLLIDDGSTDNSTALASSLDDPRVRYHRDGLNRKLNERLNQSISMARGRFIARMDADDVMHPERLQKQVAYLADASPDTVLGTPAYSIDRGSKVVGLYTVPARQKRGFAARNSFVHPTVAAHTSWFRKNLYSPHSNFNRSEDAELWCRTSASAKFEWLSEPLVFYRAHGRFDMSNYVAHQTGILYLVSVLDSTSKTTKLFYFTREVGKLLITGALAATGNDGLLTKRRHSRIKESERFCGQEILGLIERVELPVSRSKMIKQTQPASQYEAGASQYQQQ